MNHNIVTKIASIIVGLIIAVLILIMGFKLLQNAFTRASDTAPRDVVVSDIAVNSVKVTWATDQETQGVIEYGTSPTALNFFAPEAQKTKAHSVDLTLLSPNTAYYFQVRIGDKKYDNGGVPWTFTTRTTAQTQPTVQPTAVPAAAAPSPTPVSSVDIPASGSTAGCTETDCSKIKAKLGKGCTARDYSICLNKSAVTPSVSVSPTATPSATSTP